MITDSHKQVPITHKQYSLDTINNSLGSPSEVVSNFLSSRNHINYMLFQGQ